jgi:hypothetical protein
MVALDPWNSSGGESGSARPGRRPGARVAAWIEEYNTARRHPACAMERPVAWALAGRGQEAA